MDRIGWSGLNVSRPRRLPSGRCALDVLDHTVIAALHGAVTFDRNDRMDGYDAGAMGSDARVVINGLPGAMP